MFDEENGRGSDDILPVRVDWAPACRTGVAYHMRKCGKSKTQTSLFWQNYKYYLKSDNRMNVHLNNSKNINFPG